MMDNFGEVLVIALVVFIIGFLFTNLICDSGVLDSENVYVNLVYDLDGKVSQYEVKARLAIRKDYTVYVGETMSEAMEMVAKLNSK